MKVLAGEMKQNNLILDGPREKVLKRRYELRFQRLEQRYLDILKSLEPGYKQDLDRLAKKWMFIDEEQHIDKLPEEELLIIDERVFLKAIKTFPVRLVLSLGPCLVFLGFYVAVNIFIIYSFLWLNFSFMDGVELPLRLIVSFFTLSLLLGILGFLNVNDPASGRSFLRSILKGIAWFFKIFGVTSLGPFLYKKFLLRRYSHLLDKLAKARFF
ncbi:MAG: hypothetical protein A3B91_01960 [Candidatus Yanofskybacteria bacterium RIFCSPHIGHO2_02_FULL_41_29]|nr:MAG: hypothetical protein A3B91_01960 [Candidatus Yanofskybacteria bacterium RIFCSPHIGHO2_02_FULL_41_29]OGN18739.1 MAG: hypothetical protein A3F48_01550 [Candidatus Yanofskybacteria bacterium RIFCSPHIGHO2_12_FULL_41_9]OGN23545.1 MAG: hypothetical protein A2916_01395 [Candidatus Yanofskybacteria bacterium RIFCSPLOWO2_01_FULL_41_67]OGN28388.1 MAG: hypothetical protein A3H54_02725 [Candidatus Yanofskybacteria bacterium RIFCSPLOWO2_02_FULL_41_13]OGN34565.1 MAG: hypothetical protein A3F98_02455 [